MILPLCARELPSCCYSPKISGFQTLPFFCYERHCSLGSGLRAFKASAELPSFGGYSYVT